MALTRKTTIFTWTTERQDAFDALKACLLRAPILGFPTESDRFVLDMDAVGGVLNQIQGNRAVVIAYARRSLRQSQRLYCTTRREMLAAVTMCKHFRSYLHGALFTLRTDHRSLRWLQKFCKSDGMLARWYMLLGQFSTLAVDFGSAEHPPRLRFNLWCHRASAGCYSNVIMILCSRDNWVFPGLFAGCWTVFIDQNFMRMSDPIWPAVRCACPRRAPMGHVSASHRWDRVSMDILDMSVTTEKGNRYVLVIVDCFSQWTEACPLRTRWQLPHFPD